MRSGLTFTPWTRSSEPLSSVAATTNGAADEKSPAISHLERRQPVDGRDGDLGAAPRHPHAELAEQPFGVVAGRLRSTTRRRPAVREQPGEEHRRLDLRARDGQLVADRAQLPALDHDRRVAVGRLDPRAHPPQRLGDPLLRPRARATRRRRARSGPPGRRGSRTRAAARCPRCRSRAARRARAARASRRREREPSPASVVDLDARAGGRPRSPSRCRRRARSPRSGSRRPRSRRAGPRAARSPSRPARRSRPRSTPRARSSFVEDRRDDDAVALLLEQRRRALCLALAR